MTDTTTTTDDDLKGAILAYLRDQADGVRAYMITIEERIANTEDPRVQASLLLHLCEVKEYGLQPLLDEAAAYQS